MNLKRGFRELTGLSERHAGIAMKALAAILVLLDILRVILVPLTCDEAPNRSDMLQSYGDYVQLSRVTANVHILNSVLRKACVDMLGNTPFALRLSSLLALILFLAACYALVRTLFRGGFWQLCAFVMLTLNPFMFEFWGLSRGYGLAVAFMLVSILFLLRFYRDGKGLSALLSLVFAALGVWSNFALLNFYLGLCAALFLAGIFRGRILPAVSSGILVSSALAALIAGPLMKLRAANELYYGGERGLFRDTICSLVQYSLYVENPEESIILYVALGCSAAGLLLAGNLASAAARNRLRGPEIRLSSLLTILLAIPLLSLVLQHALIGTKYLIDRTALFLTLLFWINIAYWLYRLREEARIIVPSIALLIALGILVNFVQHESLRRSQMWAVDNYNRIALGRMMELHPAKAPPIRLRAWWGNVPSLDYYVHTKFDDRFEPVGFSREGLTPADTAYDFIYMPVSDTAGIAAIYRLDTIYGELNCLYMKYAQRR